MIENYLEHYKEGLNSDQNFILRKPAREITMLLHIMVFDIEDAMKKVIDNGGKIVQPVGMELPEITARFSDPAGNILGLFQQ